ncbi:uncharacterized protein BX663DRAFT_492303 [Cokeromyces recurvatus]|uniref:uncharacterized protein n=1 Tax=Cokeromyces recurvatus TaxID=90255 RepID=UPI0022212647|nr:uncharacterized protein BX663DRAFT_492303 [Cokeromyces recurvatus]KAI7907879.1 hypothetical protein BX663DRAFT_492303 [Cokeromyces recurvatus]
MSSSTFLNPHTHNLLSQGNIIEEEEEKETEQELRDESPSLRNLSISSAGSIDIHGQAVSSDILVALLDRSVEMKDLAARNTQFYDTLEHYITETQGESAWQRFQEIVYKPREKLPDRVWMNQISHFLSHNPVFLTKFKESVGYTDDNDDDFINDVIPIPRKLPSSRSSGSINTIGSAGYRQNRRSSTMSLGDALEYNDEDHILHEEAPQVPEGMFASEDQFYQQHHQQYPPLGGGGGRRRSSYHLIQSEPHPTFTDTTIEEVDEANIDIDKDDESDHLSDLLDSDEENEDIIVYGNKENMAMDSRNRVKESGAGSSTPTTNKSKSAHPYSEMDLIKLRNYPDFQLKLPQSHPSFFRKAKQLLSIAPSSRHLSATIRRNSILEDAMPPSPVAELDEPCFQTCEAIDEEERDGGHLAQLICCTRRQQPDDIAWLNSVMEALAGWPELVDQLYDIIHDSLEEHREH